jgi:hypothetical protein
MPMSTSPENQDREANVLFEMQMADPMSEEVLDANSDDVMEALLDHAADLALGPVVALNMHTCSIKLRFQVIARTDAEIHKRLAKIIAIIERETELEMVRSSVESREDVADSPTGEMATA